MLKKIGLLGVLLVWVMQAVAGEIRVMVDRNPVNLQESVKITFTAVDTPDGNPDFSPLDEDFEIINQQRSSQMSWVNGKTMRQTQWSLQVLPKRVGELVIPAINFGSDRSQPLRLSVNEAPAVKTNDDAELFLQVQAAPEQPYVQSQVLYTLRFYRRVAITQASLTEPDLKDAVVEKLGEDRSYTTQINGLEYAVTERKYAIFPQQSGALTIAPLSLTAEVISDDQPRFNGFFSRQQTQTRRITSDAVNLQVQPVPSTFTGDNWLSAEHLQLQEEWSDPKLTVKVGEPITRTLRLMATGSTVGQLPELTQLNNLDGIKTYPDQPVLKEDKTAEGLQALREEKIAYIASQPGRFNLPAIAIQWFNTRTQQMETATLPAVTLEVLAAAGRIEPANTPATAAPALATETAAGEVWVWQTLAGGLGLGWLATALWLYRVLRQNKPETAATLAKSVAKPAAAPEALQSACRQNDAHMAKQALLLWGQQQFGVDHLRLLADHCPPPLATEIVALNQWLYAQPSQDWQGQALWQAFVQAKASSKTTPSREEDVLLPLYPL